MSDRTSNKPPAQSPRANRPLTAAQRASEANRAQQIAVRDSRSQPADRRTAQPGEASSAGLDNDNRPVGVRRV